MDTTPAAPDTPRTLSNRVHWAVPVAVATVVGAAFLVPPLVASAQTADLPDTTPEELVAAVATAEPQALSGTVVYTARLGLPELPLAAETGADPVDLLGGSSTLRVWTDGEGRGRVALLGAMSEYSVVRDGPEAWTYSSRNEEAVHYTLDEAGLARWQELEAEGPAVRGDLPTPAGLADSALAHARRFSTVALAAETTVAGRDAYQLVVTPKSDATLVGRIVVAVDAETSTPLRVQVYSVRDSVEPALEVGFTDVTFATPDDAVLTFSPPAGAAVRDVVVALPEHEASVDPTAPPEGVSVTGTGWETVVEVAGVDVAALTAGDPSAMADLADRTPTIGSETGQDFLEQFGPQDGSGPPSMAGLDAAALLDQLTDEVPEGTLLSSTLFSVLFTDDGRVLVGAVPAETLRAMA